MSSESHRDAMARLDRIAEGQIGQSVGQAQRQIDEGAARERRERQPAAPADSGDGGLLAQLQAANDAQGWVAIPIAEWVDR